MDKIIISGIVIVCLILLVFRHILKIEKRIKAEKKKIHQEELQKRLNEKYAIWNKPRIPGPELIPIIKELWNDCDLARPLIIKITVTEEIPLIEKSFKN